MPRHKPIHKAGSKKKAKYKPKSGKGFGSVDGRLRTRNMRTKAKRATKRRK